MGKYKGVVTRFRTYRGTRANREGVVGGGMVRILGHNTFRKMKVKSKVNINVGDVIEFDDIGGFAQNVIKLGRKQKTLLYKS
jgi:hypothetical protein